MIDILFTSYGGSHVLMLKGIYEKLLDEKFNVKYLALTAAFDILSKEKLPCDNISKFVEEKEILFDIMIEFSLEPCDKNYYTALSLKELIDEIGINETKKLFEQYGRAIFCQKKLANKILDYYKPKILVTSNLIRLPRALYLMAENRNIKTVYIEDIFMVPSHKFINKSKYLIDLCHPFIKIDRIIVFSKEAISIVKSNLENNYISGCKQIISLGNPNLEKTLSKSENIKSYSDNSDYFLFLSNMYERENSTDLLVKYFTVFQDEKLIIKTHPLEDKMYYLKKFKNLKNVSIIDKHLIELIKSAKYILGTNSTTLLEARLMDKNVFCINISNSKIIKESFLDTKIAYEIKEFDDLCNLEKFNNKIKIKIELNSENKIVNYLSHILKGTEDE